MATSTDASFGGRTLAFNPNITEEILAATRAMPPWRACVLEDTSWSGMKDENIEGELSSFGTPDILTPKAPIFLASTAANDVASFMYPLVLVRHLLVPIAHSEKTICGIGVKGYFS